jgi:DNA polymerase-1
VFRIFLRRAIALAKGELSPWQWPRIVLGDGLDVLAALEQLRWDDKPLAVDVETAGGPEADILCIGIGNEDLAVSVPWKPGRCADEVRALLASPLPKTMHNGQHDMLTFVNHDIECNGYDFDTLLAHAVCASQLPHDLGFVAACETTAPRWKSEFRIESDTKGLEAFTKRPLAELLSYNGKDVAGTATLRPKLSQHVTATHNGPELFKEYMALSEVAMAMRYHGVKVDQSTFDRHRRVFSKEMAKQSTRFAALTHNDEAFKLGKAGGHKSLHKLFFDKLGLTPLRYSELTGEPSLDKFTLERYCATYSEHISAIARCVLEYRKKAKLLTTYIDGLPIHEDGYVHPSWKVYGTVTGRWSSSEPNAQNQPRIMRDMYVPTSGCILEADYAKLELWIIAHLANDEPLLQAFASGADVHESNGQDLFGSEFIPGDKGQRTFAKNFVYALNYGAEDETVWRTLVLKFPGLKLSTVTRLRKAWFKAHPAIKQWHRESIHGANENSYIEAPLSGRREIFHDGRIEPNKVLNYPVQATGGDLMNRAILEVYQRLGDKGRILFQVHDAIVLETSNVSGASKVLQEAMEKPVELNGHTVSFPVDFSIGPNWGSMKETPREALQA